MTEDALTEEQRGLVERLKRHAGGVFRLNTAIRSVGSILEWQAAREIEALAARVAELEGALRLAHDIADSWIHDQLDGTGHLERELEKLAPATQALNRKADQ